MRALPFLLAVVVLASASRARAQACEDDALAEAAAELLLAGGDPTGAELVEAARRAGSDAPTVHALAIHDGDRARVGPWLARLGARLRAPVTCGEARRDDRSLVIAAPRAGSLVTTEDEGRWAITLAPGFSEPTVFIEDGRGGVVRVEPVDGHAQLPSDLELPARVQLVARGPDGPRPVAERSIGGTPESARPSSDETPLDARVEALRARGGASPLRPNRLLAGLAEEHAQRVCRAGRAAHELEPGRDPRARARERGIEARHVGEVVARGAGVGAAFDALVRSPSHRTALADRRFTDAGAGIATDARGRVCVVVMLAAWPRLVGR